MKQLSIAAKLYLTMSLVGLTLLLMTLSFTYQHERNLVRQMASNQATALASSYFESVNTLMLSGAMTQQPLLHQKMLSQANVEQLEIIRGQSVTAMFGSSKQATTDDELSRRALNGEAIEQFSSSASEPLLTILTPIVMTSNHDGIDCLMCHATSTEGEIGGAVRIHYSLADAEQRIYQALWQQAGLLAVVFVIGIAALALVFRRTVVARLNDLRKKLALISHQSDLSIELRNQHSDEIGQVYRSIEQLLKQFHHSVEQLASHTHLLHDTAEQVHHVAASTEKSVVELKEGTDSVATTMTQMESSSAEVLQNAKYTAERSASANQQARSGAQESQRVREQIEQLAKLVASASDSLEQLEERSDKVSTVVEVISSIAEQTNLLALNAAIEAARAGEQGRGFSVVADEVRSLANRTHDSTDEIKAINEELRQQKNQVFTIIEQVIQSAQDSSGSIQHLAEQLQTIETQSDEISKLNAQVAQAANEQTKAMEEINRHLGAIRQIAEQSAEDAATDNAISDKVVSLSEKLEAIVNAYKL
ncbi:methyl-accepting chemotaxis protein [Neiella marina]|uniref:Methyl-accepting chemotaxis protein n=1 Tax=Neiella marina TaxID=508461 RepID=A0A8J2XN47_9GAMM|nr:methyl-accepting chemotaxis protein [Neiella marina]GGA65599.1 methyl-accepting chemotaxis protein [Neiella marina]